MLGNGTIGGEEPLGLSWRLEPQHAPFPLAGGLMGVLRPVIQIAMLAMFYTRQELSLGGSITLQLIRDEDPWGILASFEELAEEFLRRLLVSPALHQDVEDMAVLIDRSPEIGPLTTNREKDLIQLPLITSLRATVPKLIRILLAELPTPLAHRFIGHDDATGE
jgi:hypothetical protein